MKLVVQHGNSTFGRLQASGFLHGKLQDKLVWLAMKPVGQHGLYYQF